MVEQKTLLQCRNEIETAFGQLLNLVSLLHGKESVTMTMSIGCNPDLSYLIEETWETQKIVNCDNK